jgi:hypothetical protein
MSFFFAILHGTSTSLNHEGCSISSYIYLASTFQPKTPRYVAAAMAMYCQQHYKKMINSDDPGKWTWKSSKYADTARYGRFENPCILFQVKRDKIAKIEAKSLNNPAFLSGQKEQGFGVHVRSPRAMLEEEGQNYPPPSRITRTVDTSQAAMRISTFLDARQVDRDRSTKQTPRFKYSYILPRNEDKLDKYIDNQQVADLRTLRHVLYHGEFERQPKYKVTKIEHGLVVRMPSCEDTPTSSNFIR